MRQDDYQLYHYQLYLCLTQSITSDSLDVMANEYDEYSIEGVISNRPSGVCYLKVLLNKAEANARAFTAYVRKQIKKLPSTIGEDKTYNIQAFNQVAKKLMKQL